MAEEKKEIEKKPEEKSVVVEKKTDEKTGTTSSEPTKKKSKKFNINDMVPWQKKRLFLTLFIFLSISLSFLTVSAYSLYNDKKMEDEYWDDYLTITPELQDKVLALSTDATRVSVGSYIENLKEINIKSNSFSLDYLVWFNWDGPEELLDMNTDFKIYKGNISMKHVVKEKHEDNHNYLLLRLSVTISKTFWTPRFPLESHQLRIYVEASDPVNKVVFVNDAESSTNPNLTIAGYNLERFDSAVVANAYPNAQGDPDIEGETITSELVTQIEINRSSFGTYFKCFIALLGTSVWVFITLYINTKHHVDPLGMIPAALFGTVSNIMVGANLLPDAMQLGLVEYVNFWGILTILSVAFTVINVNRIRSKYDDRKFAGFYGQIMFWTILIVIVAGHFILPLSAYKF